MKSSVLLCCLLEISLVLSASGLSSNDINLFEVVSSDVTFRLYTRASPTNYIPLQTGQLSGAALDASKPFKFIIHGYTDNAGKQWVIDMKDAYLTKGDYNVIAVDWSGPAMELYSESAANTKDVGKYVALFITDLKNTLGVPYDNVHLVGHSLGSHVCGFCGQYLLGTVGATVARITGMDPAGPAFNGVPPDSRLSPGDAVFTDIIHTDGGVVGYFDVCGDIDFYPNGGIPLQPGCLTRNVARIDFTILSAPDLSRNGTNLFEVVSSDVTFRLYTRASPTNYIPLQTGQLSGAALDASKPFKFIIHGYTDNAGRDWIIEMKDAYLKKGDYNVIAVDWSGPALELYSESAANTKDVGKFVALLITDLKNTLGVPFENVHLVGHSLGSHVCGFCGQYLLSSVGATIARITGMDPAGPLFVGVPPDSRLSPGDAVFVDIIHTAGTAFGYFDVCGDIDFYPNGGRPLQPGCLTRTEITRDIEIPCSHLRAYIYHTESINSVGFISRECDSYLDYWLGSCNNNQIAIMGENVDQSLRGVYYLLTNAFPPYARNKGL